MSIVVFSILTIFLLLAGAILFWVIKITGRKYTRVIIAIPLFILLGFGLTYIPHSIVNIDPSNVSKITVFDGSTGYEIEIMDKAEIDYIINNLNEVTFQKGKSSFGLMGYKFKTTIYNHKGKKIKQLIINSNDRVRYRGFFYTAKNQSVDYDYIESLFND